MFKVGMHVKYYKSYCGYVHTTIKELDIDNDTLTTEDNLVFALNGVEINGSKSPNQKFILEEDN